MSVYNNNSFLNDSKQQLNLLLKTLNSILNYINNQNYNNYEILIDTHLKYYDIKNISELLYNLYNISNNIQDESNNFYVTRFIKYICIVQELVDLSLLDNNTRYYYYPIIPSNLFDLAKQDFANFIVETFPLYDIKCMTNAVSNEIIKIEQKITNIEMEVVQQYIC